MKIRVVVPVYDEEVLLPHFLRHYEAWVDSFIVWDNGSTDRTAEIAQAHPKVDHRVFQTESYDEISVLQRLHDSKLESAGWFDWCLFPDVDEFITPWTTKSVREILGNTDAEVLVPRGWCLMQTKDDPPIDWSRNLLAQRRYGYMSTMWSKPIIIRPEAHASFQPGKHLLRRRPSRIYAAHELLLLHVEQIDFDHWVYRKNRRPLSERNIRNKWSTDRFCRPLPELRELWKQNLEQTMKVFDELPR